MGIIVKPNEQDLMLDLVKEAQSKFNRGTFQLRGINILRHEQLIFSLSHLIKIQGYENNNLKRNLISNVVKATKTYKRLTKYNFLKRLEIEVRNFEKLPLKTYWILFPSNIKHNTILSQRRSFTLNGTRIFIRNYSQITNNFDMSKLNTIPPFLGKNQTTYLPPFNVYFLIKQDARDEDEAFHQAYNRFGLFISILNFGKAFRKIFYLRSNIARPPSFIEAFPPEYMFIFDNKRKYVIYGFTTEDFKRKPLSFNQQQFDVLMNNIKHFNEMGNNELKEILTISLILYNSALEKLNYLQMFLTFWQVLETITLSDVATKTLSKLIKSRLSVIMKISKSDEIIIEEICEKRNQLVHTGNVDIEDADLSFIKNLCDLSILFLWKNTDTFDNRFKLEKYYKLVNQNNKDLTETQEVIEKIFKNR